MIKLPKTIQVGARNYQVKDQRDYAHTENYGETCHEKQIIHIYQSDDDNPQIERVYLDTVLHELGHAGCGSYATTMSFDKEEKMVNLFARIYADLLINNPDLLRYINEACKKIRRTK